MSLLTEACIALLSGKSSRTGAELENGDEDSKSVATSTISLSCTNHCAERLDLRDVRNRIWLQGSIKYGQRKPNTKGRSGWIYRHNGITHVTDQNSRTSITAWLHDKKVDVFCL
jgi:hypothetical protein